MFLVFALHIYSSIGLLRNIGVSLSLIYAVFQILLTVPWLCWLGYF